MGKPKQIKFDKKRREFVVVGTKPAETLALENVVCIGSELISVISHIVESHPKELEKQSSEVAQSIQADYFILSKPFDRSECGVGYTHTIATLYAENIVVPHVSNISGSREARPLPGLGVPRRNGDCRYRTGR